MKTNVFQETLAECFNRFGDQTAIRYGARNITFHELNKRSNYLANWIVSKGMRKESLIGILFDDRVEVIASIIGILKAGCIFVPLVSDYPGERLAAMIAGVGIEIILTDTANLHRFKPRTDMTERGVEVFLFQDIFLEEEPGWFLKPPGIRLTPEDKIYIYFTSGTTGKPKAIVGKNKSLAHFIKWEIETFNINEQFRTSQLITPVFDAFLRDIFVPFCAGGVLCIPGNPGVILDPYTLMQWLEKHKVNLVHCVPTFFRLLNSKSLDGNSLKTLKFILLSGEKIDPAELVNWYNTIGDRIQLVNFYGPTETTMIKSYYLIRPSDVKRERIPIGKPMRGCRLMVLDENMNICEKLVTGEIYIRTPFGTFGYYNDTPSTDKKFIRNPFTDDPDSLLYKTGDLGKVLPDGNIELLGRVDRQVKIRGIRIELEEIENVLSRHPSLKQAVVIKAEISSTNEFLCAFITTRDENEMEGSKLTPVLKDYLSERLPEYMMPAKIIKINEMPLKPNGKIDYEVLQEQCKIESMDLDLPTDYIQVKLLDIWSEIFERKSIGINANFFELGGNSLNIMTLLAKIHQEFDVRIPLGKIFNNSTIALQAKIIKNANQDKFASIETVEQRDYYVLSSAQKRLYIIHKMNPGSTAYNISKIVVMEGELDLIKFEESFRKLIKRHESLRTSFGMLGEEPIQRIHQEVEFEIKNYEVSQSEVEDTVKNVIQSFDLSKAPLLRVGLIHTPPFGHPQGGAHNSQGGIPGDRHILVVDLHHIIFDEISETILIRDFMALYAGDTLSPLRLQYKDYSEWQNRRKQRDELAKQEEFLLKQFEGELPVLNLPMDYIRPAVQSFEGSNLYFEIEPETFAALKTLALQEGTTLFIILLSLFNIMLTKISSTEDIIVGSPAAGRRHADFEQIIGMLVNTLVSRNYPRNDKTFRQFLEEVTLRTLDVFENQDYQFEALIKRLGIDSDPGRNPLFDVLFVLKTLPEKEVEMPGVKLMPYKHDITTSKFDLTLNCQEAADKLYCRFEYCTKLFNRQKIERFITYFKEIVEAVLKDKDIMLGDIKISHALISLPREDLKMDFAF